MSASIPVRVREVMKRHIDFVDGMSTVSETMDEMRHIETKTMIINKRHPHDEYGIVTLSDIATKVLATDRSPERVNVYEIMTKPVISVNPDMDIRYCARLFHNFKLTRAPVVDDGQVVGVVSMTDMVLKGMLNKNITIKDD